MRLSIEVLWLWQILDSLQSSDFLSFGFACVLLNVAEPSDKPEIKAPTKSMNRKPVMSSK